MGGIEAFASVMLVCNDCRRATSTGPMALSSPPLSSSPSPPLSPNFARPQPNKSDSLGHRHPSPTYPEMFALKFESPTCVAMQTIREKRADARVALQARLATARSSEIMDPVDPFLEKCFAKGRRKGRYTGWYTEEANGSVRFAKKQLARLGGCSAEELDAQFDSVWDSADEEEEEEKEEENIVEQDKRLGVDHLERRDRSGVDAYATQELEAPPAPEDVWMW